MEIPHILINKHADSLELKQIIKLMQRRVACEFLWHYSSSVQCSKCCGAGRAREEGRKALNRCRGADQVDCCRTAAAMRGGLIAAIRSGGLAFVAFRDQLPAGRSFQVIADFAAQCEGYLQSQALPLADAIPAQAVP